MSPIVARFSRISNNQFKTLHGSLYVISLHCSSQISEVSWVGKELSIWREALKRVAQNCVSVHQWWCTVEAHLELKGLMTTTMKKERLCINLVTFSKHLVTGTNKEHFTRQGAVRIRCPPIIAELIFLGKVWLLVLPSPICPQLLYPQAKTYNKIKHE